MKSWFNKKNKSKFVSEKKNMLNKKSVSDDTDFFDGEVDVINCEDFEDMKKSLYNNRKWLYAKRRLNAIDVEFVEL